MLLFITALLLVRMSIITGNDSLQLVEEEERGKTWTWDGCLSKNIILTCMNYCSR